MAFTWLITTAQPLPPVPPQATPGVLQQQLRRMVPEPSITDKAPTPIPVPAFTYPSGAEAIRLTVRTVELSGNTAIPTAELAPNWADMTDREVPATAIYDLANTLTSIYRNRGYVLSAVLVTQDVVKDGLPDGVLRLHVIEGYVGRVQFDPELENSPRIREEAQVIMRERPLTIRTLERQLLIINDIPGVAAQAYLDAAGPPGEAVLTLKTARNSVSGFAGIQNRVSELLGNVLIEGRVSLFNAFGQDEAQTLLLQTTETSRLRSLGYAYDQPLGTSGLMFNGFLAHIESKSSLTEADLFRQSDFLSEVVRSTSDIATFGVAYPLIRGRGETLRVRGRFNIYDGKQKGELLQIEQQERVRALRVGLSWDRSDASGINFANADVSQGIPGLGSTSSDSPTAIRRDADYGFSKVDFLAGRLQRLGGDFSLLASVQGQWTNDRLPSSERAALGGELILRAFDAGDLIGDRAAAGKLELRYEPALIPGGRVTFYAYAEVGRTTSIEIAPIPNLVSRGSDTGLGVRGSLANGVNFYAEVATPHEVYRVPTRSRSTRFFTGLSYQF
ncbi:ShlB/FhaC/HecB family hemolysin secretion/activation protein [Variovorax sp. J22R115]|uniref:ShlB/FhaC/HecB family hemolysin secretion/activation protein n=1 Tax=Variovorax sp. J22R115 TaxID=3053509 RepID=UPI00257782F8|nr:ShlB/FhaC/HecB family hemolysin secretion/activation protein [Variovorax sp. J22R115]MDM0053043.1 ShlB/FhaC/HecB family hemolysin secretion/activation protein [Variovorax sp. J22R115]